MYRQCKTFQQSPSQTFGIRNNPWLAWQFDQAILTWGTWVQNRLDERDKEGRPKYNARQALGLSVVVKPINVNAFRAFSNVEIG